MTELYRPAGAEARDGYALDLSAESAGWDFSGLRVLELPPGGRRVLDTGTHEVVVLPLAGSCTVSADGQDVELAGRDSVFTGVSDYAYVPRDTELAVSTVDGGRFALASARARRRLPLRYVSAKEVPVELRGAGSCARQVNNFAVPGVLDADRLIACEVLTPAGNLASYAPDKQHEERSGESELE